MRNLPHALYSYLVNHDHDHEEDFFKFCVLLRKSELWYRLSADSRATRVLLLIFTVKNIFFPKNAKNKGVWNAKWPKNLTRIVRNKSPRYRPSCRFTNVVIYAVFAPKIELVITVTAFYHYNAPMNVSRIWLLCR